MNSASTTGLLSDEEAAALKEFDETDEEYEKNNFFSFASGDGDMDNAVFEIDGDDLKMVSSADFELKKYLLDRVKRN